MYRPYNSNRKKIRGWKRRIRQINEWGERLKQPNLEWFKRDNARHYYERCYLSPFYRLDKRQPPLWFFKLIIAKFIEAYDEWEKTFDELGLPYDLQVMIYDPAYISSEIISYRMKEHGEHMNVTWLSEENKPFPYKKFEHRLYDLTQFDWRLADDQHIHFEDELEDADFTAEDLLNDGYIKKTQGNGDVYYAIRLGDEWIGRRKGKLDIDSKSRTWSYQAPPTF